MTSIPDHTHEQYLTSIDLNNYALKIDLPTDYINSEEFNESITSLESTIGNKLASKVDENSVYTKGFVYNKNESDERYQEKGEYALKSEIPSLDGYVKENQLFSKKYEDLLDTPVIPSTVAELTDSDDYATKTFVTEEILRINQGETPELNLDGYAKTEDIPTRVSQLENDENYLKELPKHTHEEYLTEHQDISGKLDRSVYDTDKNTFALKTELFSKSYNDLADKPEIPSLDGYATQEWVEDKKYLTSIPDHTHDEYLTEVPAHEHEQYLTEHQDISGKLDKSVYNADKDTFALKTELFSKSYNELTDKPEIPSLNGYATQEWVEGKKYLTSIPEHNHEQYLTEHQSLDALETKADASQKLLDAKKYTDDKLAELVDGAPEALNTIKEVGVALNEQNDVILALETTIGSKANSSDVYLKTDVYSKTETENSFVKIETLSNYAKVSQIPSLDGYAKTEDIPSLEEYALKTELSGIDYNTLTNKPEIPSIEGLVSETTLNDFKDEVNNKNYLTSGDLNDYVLKSDINLENYVTASQIEGLANMDDVKQYVNSVLETTPEIRDAITEISNSLKEEGTEQTIIEIHSKVSKLETDLTNITNNLNLILNNIELIETKNIEFEKDIAILKNYNYFVFENNSGISIITKYTGNEKIVAIPDNADVLSSNVFKDNTTIEKIIFPDRLYKLDTSCFENCTSLKKIELSLNSSLETIGERCFYGSIIDEFCCPKSLKHVSVASFAACSNLKSFNIPEDCNLLTISDEAFAACTNLISFEVPKNVTYLGLAIFSGCDSLTSLTVNENNIKYYSKNNCIIDKNNNTVVVGCSSSIIPSGSNIECIGSRAFQGARLLENIIIPEGVTSIDMWAFNGCSSVKTISLPSTINSINNRGLVTSSNKLESISVDINNKNYHSINNCLIETSSGTLVLGCGLSRIPDDGSVTSIGIAAFQGCNNLISITIPNNIYKIGEFSFAQCENLTTVILPKSITSIEDNAFMLSKKIQEVYYEGTEDDWNHLKYNIGLNSGYLINATINYNYKYN